MYRQLLNHVAEFAPFHGWGGIWDGVRRDGVRRDGVRRDGVGRDGRGMEGALTCTVIINCRTKP